jgi:hypothetical protein
MLIASSSGFFNPAQNADLGDYYVGSNICGWNGCEWDFISGIHGGIADGPMRPRDAASGIITPYDTPNPCKYTLCVQMFSELANGGDIGAASLSWFSCSEATQQGAATIHVLGESQIDYNNDHHSLCLSFNMTVYEPLDSCDTMFLVGLTSRIQDVQKVKFTWTLKATF